MKPSSPTPSSPDLGFGLVAGALAGLLVGIEVGLLEIAVWTLGGETRLGINQLGWLSLESSRQAMLYLLAAGLIGGLAASLVLSRVAPAIRQTTLEFALSLWVLGSFIHVISGHVAVSVKLPFLLVYALLTLSSAIAAYCLWCGLLQWLRQGQVKRVMMVIVALIAGFWGLIAACIIMP